MAVAPAPASLWLEQAGPAPAAQRLPGPLHCDVAIAGGGYTGLWLAYYLKSLAPATSVVVLEARHCGYGASGRNGGWLMGSLEGEARMLAALPPERRAEVRALTHGILPEVERVLADEAIDCHYQRGGGLFAAARYPEQAQRARAALAQLQALGYGEGDYRWLERGELLARLQVAGGLGAIYTPHIARIQPALLVRGLQAAVRRLGVSVFEATPVTGASETGLLTDSGEVCARYRVLALEGYSPALAPVAGRVLPIQSRIIATEPLSDAQWQGIGLQQREVFCDHSPLVTYAQRSADNRLVFGARGSYQFGGRVRSEFTTDRRAFDQVQGLMLACLPQLEGVAISHRWGGTLGASRSGLPHAVLDPLTGLATAGGYLGEGVGASNLMARTLADLILARDSALAAAPWAQRAPLRRALRRWEPEPLRWLGYRATDLARRAEERACVNGAPLWWRRLAAALSAGMDRLRR